MIWLVLALIGAGTFFVTGFNLLTDPLCVSADFGGGRVVQVTCRSDEFGTVTGTKAGLISILIGLGILTLIFWRPIKVLFLRNKLIREARYQMDEDKTDVAISNSVSELPTNSSGVTKKCPKCAEDIKSEAVKCRFCGSDLGPKGIEQTSIILNAFLKKYINSDNSFQIAAVILVVLMIGILSFLNISKTRELSALKESGQVCVFNQDKSIDFGCADYPQLKFNVCTSYKYMDWSARVPEYTFISGDTERSVGKMELCTSRFPYRYSFDYTFPETIRLGEYEIFGQAYKYINGYDYIENGYISDLVLKVSLK